MQIPMPSVPAPTSAPVRKLQQALKVTRTPIVVKVQVVGGDRERNCFVNVQQRVDSFGGSMLLGWAIWQVGDLFIEAERHAIWQPPKGGAPVDCTPHPLPIGDGEYTEILFLENPDDSYNPADESLVDNVRVPLVDAPRLRQALSLFATSTEIKNSVPGIDVELPESAAREYLKCQCLAGLLLEQVAATSAITDRPPTVGRNAPCPCGSGKKFKRCHGSIW